eukprot:scpid17465/ scgid1966/ Protein disabled
MATTLRKTLFNSVRAGSGAQSADRGKEINTQQVSSIADEDFSGKGVDLNVKYYGRTEMSKPRGDKLAHNAMHELKHQLAATSGHKQRVTMNLSMFGVALFDDKRSKEIARHAVKAISFMTIDPEDTKVFAYIAAEGPNEQNPTRIFRLYCFKSEKQTPLITKSLMRVFKLAQAEKERKGGSVKDRGGSQLSRKGTTKNSPLPPLPPPGEAKPTDESPYATLSSTVSPTLAKTPSNRNSLALIDFNMAQVEPAETTAAPPVTKEQAAPSANLDAGDSTYATINRGSKSNFTLAQFGLILASISDTTALPAPIGAPFMDVASNPFEERKVEVHSEVPASTSGQTVRASTIMTFDPVFGTTGGEQQPSADGFETDFASLGADPAAVADPDSQVYAVPRFPPIRAVLGDDECDTGRDSGALFS